MTGETGRPREAGRLPSLLTRVLDLLPLGAAIMSFDAGICYVNDALREMTRGWHSELRPYEDGRVGSPEMERQLQEGAIAFFESEIRCERVDGENLRLRVRKHLVRDDDQNPACFVFFVRRVPDDRATGAPQDIGALLTPREAQIGAMIARGMTSKEVAQTLGVSLRCVESHRCNMRRKLDLRHKGVNLARWLRRNTQTLSI